MTDEGRRLAEKIAKRLFVNGSGQHAERLVLMAGTPERDLGGWCKAAVEDQIQAVLREEAAALFSASGGEPFADESRVLRVLREWNQRAEHEIHPIGQHEFWRGVKNVVDDALASPVGTASAQEQP